MAKPSDLDLASVYAKLDWAVTHFKTLDAEIEAWLYSGENMLIYERNEDFTQHYLRAHMPGPRPNFQRWSLMIGDVVTNLRDTLDHAVYAIASLASSPNSDKRDKACFLMTSSPEYFRKWGKTKLASVPPKVRDVIFSFQPYNRPHQVLPPLLFLLSELANGNKHRLLNVAITSPAIAQIRFVSRDGFQQKATTGVSTEDVEHGKIVFIFEVPNPDPSIYLHSANAGLLVAVKHSPRDGDTSFGADRTSHYRLLKALMDEVAMALDGLVSAL